MGECILQMGSGINTRDIAPQCRNLALMGGNAKIDASFSGVAAEWLSLVKFYRVVAKIGVAPASPTDGVYVDLPPAATGNATMQAALMGLTNDQTYTVRVYVRSPCGWQTSPDVQNICTPFFELKLGFLQAITSNAIFTAPKHSIYRFHVIGKGGDGGRSCWGYVGGEIGGGGGGGGGAGGYGGYAIHQLELREGQPVEISISNASTRLIADASTIATAFCGGNGGSGGNGEGYEGGVGGKGGNSELGNIENNRGIDGCSGRSGQRCRAGDRTGGGRGGDVIGNFQFNPYSKFTVIGGNGGGPGRSGTGGISIANGLNGGIYMIGCPGSGGGGGGVTVDANGTDGTCGGSAYGGVGCDGGVIVEVRV